ncbi:uncharacterized protein LOC124688226 [Lolium rigidum]|uniref:uncharacterized protein LOC124688226 n=1 Tax=Lolium rigidum TaxID=89674 RepID=UPI001F5D8E15|nr:uncharacterized protein LOC124688226 [Lolium rigidum]
MGNCQAAEAAAAVVQHPGGRVERLYWATSAAEVMRANPGHYVALVTLRVAENADGTGARRTVRLTRVKLLKPKETLLLGHVYRLITSHEVTKAVQARKEEKMTKARQQLQQLESSLSRQSKARPAADDGVDADDDDEASLDASLEQLARQDGDAHRSSGARHRQWRPSLHSIDEAAS